MPGPLDGTRILELAGIGPAPFAGMLLADLGAEVIRIQRPGAPEVVGHRTLNRSRTHLAVDLKDPDGAELVRRLAVDADALVEGFRPGVLEGLGLGPAVLLAANPALVVGRMTGWGQDGPWAGAAGHDITYIAITGALDAIGRRGQPPTVPLNLVGDFGGGATFLVIGVLAALLHARATGVGQVVDAAMVDGVTSLLAMVHDLAAAGLHGRERGTNLLDSGAWYYDVYACSDDAWVAIGPIEPAFRAELLERLGLHDEAVALADGIDGHDEASRRLSTRVAEVFASRPRAHWDDVLGGTDACYAPVLSLDEAARHPHLVARDTFVDVDGHPQPAPAPRFSVTPSDPPRPRAQCGDAAATLRRAGIGDAEVADLRERGVLGDVHGRPGTGHPGLE